MAQQPVACFPFTAGTAADVTGNGFDGAVVGPTIVVDRSGIPGGALHFDGTDDRVELGALGDMFPTDEFSVSLWLKAEASNADAVILTQADDLSDRLCIAPQYNHQGQNSVFWDYGDIFNNGRMAILPYPFSSNWDHWVFVHSVAENRMSVHVNGVLVEEELHHGAIIDRTKPIWIGGGTASGNVNFFFHGNIDDVQFYNAALTPAFVSELYTAQLAGFTCGTVGVAEADAPTPARFLLISGNLVVDWPQARTGDVGVFDAQGRLVLAHNALSGTRWSVPLGQRAPGIYTVRCVVNGQASMGRVVVE